MVDNNDNKRLDRIEAKIDSLAEAMIAIARAEEKLHNMEAKYNSTYDRMNKFSAKLDNIEAKVAENGTTVSFITKLFWVTVVAVAGSIAAQLWM